MKPHKWHKEIKAWADGAEIEYREHEFGTWKPCKEPPQWFELVEYRIKPPAKCITKDCMNHTNEGKFIGDLCAPCWDYITNGKGVHSQAYRNAQPKEPQYLYVYKDYIRPDGSTTTAVTIARTKLNNEFYIGKIKLEVDDGTNDNS